MNWTYEMMLMLLLHSEYETKISRNIQRVELDVDFRDICFAYTLTLQVFAQVFSIQSQAWSFIQRI